MLDSRALRALLSLGMVVGLGATGTYAYWTDQATITGTTITAGTIDLKASAGASGYQDNPSDFVSMNVSTMVPGDSSAGVFLIKNNGTAPLKYWIDASATNTLGPALVAKVTGDAAVNSSGGARAVTCSGTALAGSGTAFGPSLLNTSSTGRTLAAGASEPICVQATLPTNAATTLQGVSTQITFTVTGTSF